MNFIHYIKWLLNGKPMITLPGKHCGCCGKWIAKPFKIRNYDSKENIEGTLQDYWFETWGLCDDCRGGN